MVYKIQFPEFGILSRNRDVNGLFAFSETFGLPIVGTPADAYISRSPIYNYYGDFENLIGSRRQSWEERERERQICG